MKRYKMFYRRVLRENHQILTFKQYVKEYLEKCTITGLKHFAAPRLHPLELLVWFLVMLVAIYCCIGIIYSNWVRYDTNPIVQSVEKNYREWEFETPAVTLCYLDKVEEEKAKIYIKSTWGGVNSSMEEYYMRFLNTVVNMSCKQLDGFKEFAGDTNLENIDLLDLAKKMLVEPDFMAQISRGPRLVHLQTVNELGFCFTFASAIQQKFQTVNVSEEQFIPEMCGIESICSLSIAATRPMQVMIHSPYEIPDTSSRILVTPYKTFQHLGLDVHQFMSSSRLRDLKPKRRNCLFRDEGKTFNVPEYSYNVCKMKCRRKLALSLCGCSPPFYEYFNAVGKSKICNITGMVCLLENKEKLLTLRNKKGEKIDCNCLSVCEHTLYNVHDIHFPTGSVRHKKYIQFIMVGVTQPGKIRYKKDVLFTFQDLLVSFGGTAGFFLGCSFLSFLELIYFFTLRLLCYLYKRCRINIAPEPRRHRFLFIHNQ